jgi:hypothetical protein
MRKLLFTRKNIRIALAISIAILIFNLISRPFEHLFNGIITQPTTELAMIIVISSFMFTVGISIISFLVCIKILKKK